MRNRDWAVRLFLFLFIGGLATVWALTKVTGLQIVNSTLDSTPIGEASVADGHFSYTQAASNPGSSIAKQGAYLGWNLTSGTGETDFINDHGSGPGGFYFYNTGGSVGNPIALLDNVGDLHAGGQLTVDANMAYSVPTLYWGTTGASIGVWPGGPQNVSGYPHCDPSNAAGSLWISTGQSTGGTIWLCEDDTNLSSPIADGHRTWVKID
jgi:hypothetical protein